MKAKSKIIVTTILVAMVLVAAFIYVTVTDEFFIWRKEVCHMRPGRI
ncbi:hypothetical protein SAMN02910371_02111 [Butyrivibrio sp. INlla14]|nr:hypothetical protein SAMN02910371_02111 [Butyrivibrio sp. INlla14]